MQPSASRAGAPPSSTGERKAQVSWQSQARGLTRHPGLLTTQGGPFPPPGFSPISPQPEDVSNTGEVPCARTDASCPCPFWAGPSVGVSTQGQGGGHCGSWAAPGRVSWVREGAFPRGYCLLLCELGKMVPTLQRGLQERNEGSPQHGIQHMLAPVLVPSASLISLSLSFPTC